MKPLSRYNMRQNLTSRKKNKKEILTNRAGKITANIKR